MSKLTELTEAYLNARSAAEGAKEIAENCKQLLQTELEEIGLKSIKTADGRATVSIVNKPVYSVNEVAVTHYLADQPGLELDLFYTKTLNKKMVLDYASKQLKETGEVIPGIETSESEYLMVRENKEVK